jgi:uncharacterized membrane protein YbhN (UPF0104 family)
MKLGWRVGISLGLLSLILALLPWDTVTIALSRMGPWRWLAVLAGFVAGHLVGIIKWRGFVAAGRGVLPARDAAQCYSAGLFANLCLPSIAGGDLLRMVMAGRSTRRPEAAFIGGVMDRLTDTIALALLAGGGALAVGGRVGGGFVRVVSLTLLAGLAAGALAAVLAGRTRIKRWPARLRRPVGRSLVGLRHLRRRPGVAARGLALSLAIQGGFVLLNAEMGRGMGLALPLGAWFLAWPLAKVVSLLPISLGGLAVREASLASLLVPFGVPLALGVTVSLVWQSVLIAGGLLGGATWWMLSRVNPIPAPALLRPRVRTASGSAPHD